jgi:hypothetical protein
MNYETLIEELQLKLLNEPSNTQLMNKLAIANLENANYEEACKLFEKLARDEIKHEDIHKFKQQHNYYGM